MLPFFTAPFIFGPLFFDSHLIPSARPPSLSLSSVDSLRAELEEAQHEMREQQQQTEVYRRFAVLPVSQMHSFNRGHHDRPHVFSHPHFSSETTKI